MRTSSDARPFVTWAPLAAPLVVLLPALAAAQEPVTSFDQLNTRLKVGDTVWVTDAQGREIKGRITSFAPDAVGVEANGAQVLRADEVQHGRARRDHLTGAGAAGFGSFARHLAALSGLPKSPCGLSRSG